MTADGALGRLGGTRRRAHRSTLRVAGAGGGAAIVACAALVVSLGVGELAIAPGDVVLALVGAGRAENAFVVLDLRLPRALVALAVGAALGAAGAILQGLTRNALAAPEIIGVAAGANVAAVVVVVAVPATPIALLTPAAFVGALAATALVYALAWRSGGTSGVRLILVGVGISVAGQAIVIAAISSVDEVIHASQLVIFMAGSVYAKGWADLVALAPWLAVLLPAAVAGARQLDALRLGDEVARGLGVGIERTRLLLLLSAAGLAGAAVAVAGPVGFVGLIAPHIARRLVGTAHAAVILLAAIAGGTLVIVADLLARTLFAPVDLPVGVLTAVVGAPYFLALLRRAQAVETRR